MKVVGSSPTDVATYNTGCLLNTTAYIFVSKREGWATERPANSVHDLKIAAPAGHSYTVDDTR